MHHQADAIELTGSLETVQDLLANLQIGALADPPAGSGTIGKQHGDALHIQLTHDFANVQVLEDVGSAHELKVVEIREQPRERTAFVHHARQCNAHRFLVSWSQSESR